MGIPGLASQLHKYGSHVSIPQQKANTTTHPVAAVIDGPSLAHSIYRTGKFGLGSEGIVTHCDYAALGKAAIAWLDRLRSYTYEMYARSSHLTLNPDQLLIQTREGIYFDGALPAYKTPIRLDRMQSYVNRIVSYKHLHDQASKTRKRKRGRDNVTEDRSTRGLEKAKTCLPPPPFLVFAVAEALAASRYADRTWVVNGEADSFCAAAAADPARRYSGGSTIFTNDSDLVLFDFDEAVRVAIINEMQEGGSVDGNRLEVFDFDIEAMRARIPATDWLASAFIMKENQVSLAEAMRRSNEVDQDSPQYRDFGALYDLHRWDVALLKLRESRRLGDGIVCTDSRISEPLCQDDEDCLDLYLPVLFEDPTRASAWKIGSEFREVALSMIVLRSQSASRFKEYKRSGIKITAALTEGASELQIKKTAETCSENLRHHFENTPADIPLLDRWRVVVVRLLLQDMSNQDIALPLLKNVVNVACGQDLTCWEDVHVAAQFQAMYYSLRIVQQVFRVYRKEFVMEDAVALTQLHEHVRELPPIAEFFTVPSHSEAGPSRGQWQKLLGQYLEKLNAFKRVDGDGMGQTSEDDENEAPGWLGAVNNPFGVLREST